MQEHLLVSKFNETESLPIKLNMGSHLAGYVVKASLEMVHVP